jgi:ribonuclease-3
MKKENIDNEKFEFLGDSVINLVVTEYLFKRFKGMQEGELSKLKAHLVSTSFLYDVAQSVNLSDYVFLGKGEERNEGRKNQRIIASLFEAVVGAIYLDGGFKATTNVLFPFFKEFIERRVAKEEDIKINDYKSELQEILQRHRNILPEYKILEKYGKPPNTTFIASIYLDNREIGRGKGKSKRQAEQNAAFEALKELDNVFNYEKLSGIFFIKK